MRRIPLLILLVLSIPFISALKLVDDPVEGKVDWVTFEEAMRLNEKEPRMILIDMYTDWCGWCKRMERDVYAKDLISNYLNDKYYAVKFNTERTTQDIEFQGRVWKFVPPPDGGRRGIHHLAYALMGEKASYPTTVILNEKLERLPPIPGYQKAPFFDMVLKYYGEGVYKTTPWADFQKTYDSPFGTPN